MKIDQALAIDGIALQKLFKLCRIERIAVFSSLRALR